ncbi:MAG: N-acyl-D-amino-acid deacylase family protein [Acidobacteriota bacterium]
MTLLHGGTLIDGSGSPATPGDLLFDGDTILALGAVPPPADALRLDCTGLLIAPGFIDLHSHSDLQVLERHRAKTDQGVTTEVVGNCGFSAYPCGAHRHEVQEFANGILFGYGRDWAWPNAQQYLAAAATQATLVNVHSLVGHGTLRVATMGPSQAPATPAELDRMEQSLAECLSGGAAGFSTGLMYAPGSAAPTEELEALCRVTARAGKVYATHMRSYGDDLLNSLDEQLALARSTGCRLQISHLQAVGRRNWHKQSQALEKLAAARHQGLDVAFDSYPYLAGSTVLTQLLPAWALDGGAPALLARLADPALCARIKATMIEQTPQQWSDIFITAVGSPTSERFVGHDLASIGETLGEHPVDAALHLLRVESANVNILAFNQSDDNLRHLLTHPLCTVISDGFYVKGRPHPRLYGTFPFLLGEIVRERRWMPLEQAIHKITAQPAARFAMPRQGLLAPGYYADLTVFDPTAIAVRATYEAPETAPAGILHCFRRGRRTV